MPDTVKLANGTTFLAGSEQSILEAAKNAGVTLEHSCRAGRCGVCKVKVISGTTQIIQNEESLGRQEVDEGLILTCCRAAASDLYLDTEDLGVLGSIQVKILPCRIDNLLQLTDDVMEVVVRTPPSTKLEYLSGQYVDMIAKNGLRRSYSIANARRGDGKITLQIRKVADGQMSHYWFNEAKPNDLLRMEGPLGTFCLREVNAKNLVLLATGTGIAPIKAILEQLMVSPEKNTYSHIYLYWGGRIEEDIYWKPEFPGLSLTFTPVLSRSPNWPGRTGYIQQAVIADGIELCNSVVYACGSESMIKSARQELAAVGLSASKFYSDAFVNSN